MCARATCAPPRPSPEPFDRLAQAGASGSAGNAQLAAEKAALEKELAKLKAEKDKLAGGEAPKQQKGPFGLPFAFGGAR